MFDSDDRRFYVYAMLCEDEKGSGYMKIGHSGRINRRLTNLRTACPIPAKYFALMQVPSRDSALEIEKALHKVFSNRRITGEWFTFDFRSAEDRQEFSDKCHEVFAEHYLLRTQKWWSKVSVKELDAYNKERKLQFLHSKHRKKIERRVQYRARQQQAWRELAY